MKTKTVLQLIKSAEDKRELDLSNNQLIAMPHEIENLTNLTALNLNNNELTSLPPEIGKLINLTQLHLSGNQLTSLPPEIGKLINLTVLSINGNQLSSLPPEIGKLTRLNTFSLYGNQLKSLPPEIGKLTNIVFLYLSGNQLTSIPAEIGKLANLTEFFLSENQLIFLPQEIGKLKNLKLLDISGNQLTSLPPEIGNLVALTALSISRNQLISLPPEIGKLINLTVFSLNENQLTSLPPETGNLINLTQLHLSGNQLTSLPPEIGNLVNLTQLHQSRNQLTSLPPEIVNLTNLNSLELSNNPLRSPPPEIIKQGIKAIFEFLRQPREENNEAKLLLVGQGEVGKTCLANRLINDKYKDEKTTQGIDILKWMINAPTAEKEEIKLNVWDFGGQEIYHATHQFFLTKRSIYLLVWNARKSRDYENIFYWLYTIQAFGGDSPIILVMSKSNERDDDLNMEDLRVKFPNIEGLYKVDSKDGKGITDLKDIIRQTAWKLPQMRTSWVNSWFNVRERLVQDGRDWIEYNDFYGICKKEGLDEYQINILDEYLHDLGVIIHFRDRLGLSNMVILKPEWATKAFYKILDTKSVQVRGGTLLHSELNQIWPTNIYPLNIYPKLLELMNKFELTYELPDKKSHLIAELLPTTKPEFEWNNADNLRFYYSYDFLPAGVMTRFIVLSHQDLESKPDGTHLCWREGAVLRREGPVSMAGLPKTSYHTPGPVLGREDPMAQENIYMRDNTEIAQEVTRAFVKVNPLERLIEIKINGNRARDFLSIILYQFDHINNSIKNVKIKKEIPCNCSKDCLHKFDYIELLNGEYEGIEETHCPKSWKKVSLSLLLLGYKKREERMEEIKKILQIEKVNGSVFYTEGDTNIASLINKSEFPKTPEKKESKKESLQDIIANPATIVSFILTLAGIMLQFYSNFQYAVIIIIVGVLIFLYLVILKLRRIYS